MTNVIDRPDSLNQLSCPSATQCTAVGVDVSAASYTVQEATFNPTLPGHPSIATIDETDSRASGLACPSLTQCTMVDTAGNAVTFNPQAPGNPIAGALGARGPLENVACPSASECVAIDKAGDELTFNPIQPAAAPMRLESEVLYGVGCPSVTQCTVVDESGGVSTFNPQAPVASAATTVDGSHVSVGITCPSTAQCTVIDDGRSGNTNAVTFDPATPGSDTTVTVWHGGYPGSAISCPTLTQCTEMLELSVVSTGEVTFNPQSPPSPAPVSLSSSTFPGVVCLTTASCTAVEYGFEIAFDPATVGAMGAPKWSKSKCKSTYSSWLHSHAHATRRQKSTEVAALNRQHGCPMTGL